MKSVLVTGATGFVGRHALLPLLKKNYQVHAIYSRERIHETNEIHWHQVDLHDNAALNALLFAIKPTHLLHLAWYAKPELFWTSPENLIWLQTSLQLLDSFRRAGGQRVVFVGSCAEYDWQYGHCKELLTPCIPETLYGRTKYALQLLADKIAHEQHLSLAWGRLFFLFGAHEYPQRLVPAAINHLLESKKFHVKNGGQIRDFMYVNDVADALTALLDSSITGPVNIASGKPMSITQLMSMVAEKLAQRDGIVYASPLAMKHQVLTADVMRLQAEVGWQPRYPLTRALDETIAWWSKQN